MNIRQPLTIVALKMYLDFLRYIISMEGKDYIEGISHSLCCCIYFWMREGRLWHFEL